MLFLGFNILPRSVFWSADLNGRSDNTDVIPRLKSIANIPDARTNRDCNVPIFAATMKHSKFVQKIKSPTRNRSSPLLLISFLVLLSFLHDTFLIALLATAMLWMGVAGLSYGVLYILLLIKNRNIFHCAAIDPDPMVTRCCRGLFLLAPVLYCGFLGLLVWSHP